MPASSLHILSFSLLNPYSLSLDRDGPFPTLSRLLFTKVPSIHDLDLAQYEDKTILITGATGGCGFECAKALARIRCHLILTTRNHIKSEALQKQFSSARATVEILELDMSSFDSISAFKSQLASLQKLLHIAILNAGVYQPDFQTCPETGFEEMIQVNVLSTCALTLLLRPLLAQDSRLLLVSSEAHAWANPLETDTKHLLRQLNNPTNYPCYQRYHISKLLLILWVRELSSRPEWNHTSVAAVSPGFSRSGLFRDFNHRVVAGMLESLVCRSSEQGAGQYLLGLDALERGSGRGGFWSDGEWRGPSTATTCKSGTLIQDTLYKDVLDIIKEFRVMEQLLD